MTLKVPTGGSGLFCLTARLIAKQIAFASLRFVGLRRFSPLKGRWQLKHGGLLSLLKQSQKNDLAVREFQSVVVRPGNALIDLAERRNRHARFEGSEGGSHELTA